MKKNFHRLFIIFIFSFKLGFSQSAEEWYGNASKKSLNKDYIGAINDFTKAIELEPRNSDYWTARASAKFNYEDYKGAISDCNKAIELFPRHCWALCVRASAKFELNDKYGACIDWNKAGEIDYNSSANDIREKCQ